MKKTDIFLVLVVLIVAAGAYFSGLLRPSQEGAYAVVMIDGEELERHSLEENRVFEIIVNGHKNVLEIKDGYADMIDADCPDKLCVKQGKIHFQGETIVCLPNHLVIEIQGGEESEVDMVAQ